MSWIARGIKAIGASVWLAAGYSGFEARVYGLNPKPYTLSRSVCNDLRS